MPTSTHGEVSVFVGGRWEFGVTIYNVNGTLMDVSGKTVEWAMLDKNSNPVLNSSGDVTITKPALGKVNIVVAPSKSVMVSVGRYTDYLRVEGAKILLEGVILVKKSPFGVFVSTAATFSVGTPTLGAPTLAVV